VEQALDKELQRHFNAQAFVDAFGTSSHEGMVKLISLAISPHAVGVLCVLCVCVCLGM
jgi:hypothetical protein